VDYFGNWKALQYEMKKDYEDVSVVAKYNSLDDVDFYLVSDVVDSFYCEIQCEVYDLQGRKKTTMELSQNINGQGSQHLCMKGVKEDLTKMNAHLVFTWKDEEGNQFSRSYDNIKVNRNKAPETSVELSFQKTEEGKGVITIENARFLKDFWVSSEKFGVQFERNFESLLPGTHKIEITFEEEPEVSDFKMMWL
jgi:beta-mannosidase